MPDVVFPPSSAPGPRPQEGGGRLVNAFVEKAPVGAPSDTIWRRTAGLPRLAETLSHTHTRGFLDAGGVVLWMLNERVYSVSPTFSLVNLGALLGTLPVTAARNNNVIPQMVVVTENGCFNLFAAGAPTVFADADLPAGPTSVAFLNGYFLWTFGSGQIWASDLNSVNVATNSFHTEQGLFVRRGLVYAGRFYAFGDKWTTVFRDAGTSPFPLAREVVIPRGIIGTHAIAGAEVGWANVPIFVGDDYIVYRLDGYTLTRVSKDDVSRDIQAAAKAGDGDLLEAHVYMYGGNAIWVLTYPGNWTWEYNLTTNEWNERQSYGRDDWRGRRSIRAFDRWLVGDDTTGRLFETSETYFLEDVDPLIWKVVSGSVSAFPSGIVIPRLSVNITAAVGAFPLISNPLVRISWSLDGGHTFGIPIFRKLGGPGESKWYPQILGLGLSRGQGLRIQLEVSDPVHVALMGAKVDAEDRGP